MNKFPNFVTVKIVILVHWMFYSCFQTLRNYYFLNFSFSSGFHQQIFICSVFRPNCQYPDVILVPISVNELTKLPLYFVLVFVLVSRAGTGQVPGAAGVESGHVGGGRSAVCRQSSAESDMDGRRPGTAGRAPSPRGNDP